MKKFITVVGFGALLLTASLASAQMMGGGFAGSQATVPTNTIMTTQTQTTAWPMFGFGTQAGAQTNVNAASQANSAFGNMQSLFSLMFGGSR